MTNREPKFTTEEYQAIRRALSDCGWLPADGLHDAHLAALRKVEAVLATKEVRHG
jgi:hypothetical protein